MGIRSFFLIAACAVTALAPSTALASPQDLFGYGGRTTGLAMTGVSYAEGYEAVYANPAGLARSRRRGLYIGLHAGTYELRVDGENTPLTPSQGMSIGFHLPLPFEDILKDRLVLGAAFFTPSRVILRGRILFPEAVQYPVLERAQSISILIGLGISLDDVVEGLQLGVGVSVGSNIVGQLDIFLDDTNTFQSTVETQLLTAFSPTAGIQYTAEQWGLGLTYRHEVANYMDLAITNEDLPVTLPVLTVGGYLQYDPFVVAAEGYWFPVPDVRLIAHITTRFWHDYQGNQQPTTAGSLQAPAPEFSTFPSPRIAVEATHNDPNFRFQFRAGYGYEPTPAPAAALRPQRTANGDIYTENGMPVLMALRNIDNDRHILTAGLGWGIHLDHGREINVDIYGQIHVLTPRTHEIGRTASGTAMQSDGVVLAAGWTAGMEF